MKLLPNLFILIILTALTNQIILSSKKIKGRNLLTFASTEKRKQQYEADRCKLIS